MTPSKYQKAIYEWVKSGEGDGVIDAVAGSGKSTTLLEISKLVHGTVVFLAFNSHNAKALQTKVGQGADCKTIHSLGYGAVSRWVKPARVNVQEYKYRDIAATMFEDKKEATDFAGLCDKTRSTLTNATDVDAVWEMIGHYGLDDITPAMIASLPIALQTGRTLAKQGCIDYTDMLWIPHVENLRPYRYQWVLVDEAQDLSAAQLALVMKARDLGGRMVFVGDPFQSIYGFAGADCDSFQNIKNLVKPTELPLSICYRCPSSHIELAKRIVPHIEARPGAPEGVIAHIPEAKLGENVREGDLVLCRLTAPLIKECIKLIRQRKPARVRGRDIGKNLTSIVKKAAKANRGVFNEEALERYAAGQREKLMRRKNSESALEALEDKVMGLQACWEEFGNGSVQNFCDEIENLFSDGRASVTLSTVHRAKGLEEKRVFIVKPEKLPLTWKGQQDWEFTQEMNLKYVAYTRATEELYFVDSEDK